MKNKDSLKRFIVDSKPISEKVFKYVCTEPSSDYDLDEVITMTKPNTYRHIQNNPEGIKSI